MIRTAMSFSLFTFAAIFMLICFRVISRPILYLTASHISWRLYSPSFGSISGVVYRAKLRSVLLSNRFRRLTGMRTFIGFLLFCHGTFSAWLSWIAFMTTAHRKAVSVTPYSCAFARMSAVFILKHVTLRNPSSSGVPLRNHALFSFLLALISPEYFWKLSSISASEGSSTLLRTPFEAGTVTPYLCSMYSAARLLRNMSAPVPSVSEWNSSSAILFLYTSMRKAHLLVSRFDILVSG